MGLLADDQLQQALARLPEWQRDGKAIVRRYEFRDFATAMQFVNRVAEVAERANHHPDITISYNRVALALTSHDSGGVTDRDVKMAERINAL